MNNNLKHKILSGVFWQGLERIGSQGLQVLITIILARILAPTEFGVIAIMTVFINLFNVFVDSGFSTALIQKHDMTEADCCSVFYINIVMALFLYVLMWFGAPLLESFYHTEHITVYFRVLSLILIIRSFSLIQLTLLRKRMLFHLSFRINWVALLISGITGIVMGYYGYGVWALVTQQLTNAVIIGIMAWLLVKWRPQWLFDWQRTKQLFQFGWKMFCSGFLDTLYNDIYSVVIGKIANLTMLSYYDRGKMIPMMGMNTINSTIGTVIFPAFSELQHDRDKMKLLVKRGLQNIMFCVIPILTLLFILANPLIRLLLTDKWLPSVIFVQICCVTFFWWPFHTMNLQIITACGRSDYFLILEIIKKIQGIVIIACTYRYGVVTMVAAGAAMGIIGALENGWANRWLINYAPWHQIWDIVPLLLVGCVCGTIAYFISITVDLAILQLLLGGISFCALYLIGTFFTGLFPIDILNMLKKLNLAK